MAGEVECPKCFAAVDLGYRKCPWCKTPLHIEAKKGLSKTGVASALGFFLGTSFLGVITAAIFAAAKPPAWLGGTILILGLFCFPALLAALIAPSGFRVRAIGGVFVAWGIVGILAVLTQLLNSGVVELFGVVASVVAAYYGGKWLEGRAPAKENRERY